VIVDSSAVVAILRNEAEAEGFVRLILGADHVQMSAGSYLETAIVIDASGNPVSSRRLDEFIAEAGIAIEPFTPSQGQLARAAYRDFGKGSGHPAALNFGDCIAYALAHEKGEPILFKGTDFGATDLECVLQ
jgi:ribonuclease VapC